MAYITVFPSAARTATANSSDQDGEGQRGAIFFLDISAVAGTPTLDLKIQYKDPISGNYVDVPGGAFAQKTGTGTDTLLIYPGIVETANREVSSAISEQWRAVATIAGTTPSFTFSLAAEMLR